MILPSKHINWIFGGIQKNPVILTEIVMTKIWLAGIAALMMTVGTPLAHAQKKIAVHKALEFSALKVTDATSISACENQQGSLIGLVNDGYSTFAAGEIADYKKIRSRIKRGIRIHNKTCGSVKAKWAKFNPETVKPKYFHNHLVYEIEPYEEMAEAETCIQYTDKVEYKTGQYQEYIEKFSDDPVKNADYAGLLEDAAATLYDYVLTYENLQCGAVKTGRKLVDLLE